MSTTSYFSIEACGQDGKWIATSNAPHPFSSTDGPETLPLSVWEAYVAYLNERQVGLPEEEGFSFRLVRWDITRTKKVVPPSKTQTLDVKNV